MFAQLVQFFTPSPTKHDAAVRYTALVQKSRNPLFYDDYGVPDTLDGRFEMILVHMMCEMHHVKTTDEDGSLRRALAEAFFDDMDRSLREMGVSDTGVGRRVKKMVEAFYGRIDAYEKLLVAGDSAALAEALKRNIYAAVEPAPTDAQVAALVDYVTNTYSATTAD
jgi:cytochrome b pre-mRNA-processing protein 3